VRPAAQEVAVGCVEDEGGGWGKAGGHGAFSWVGSGRPAHTHARRHPLWVAWVCRLLPLPRASA